MIGVTRIDPRSFGELFNAWIQSLGRLWKPLLPISLVPFGIVGVIVAVSFALSGYGEFLQLAIADPRSLDLFSSDEWVELLIKIGIASSISYLAFWIASAFVHLAATWIVARDIAGTPAAARPATQAALRRLPSALGAQALIGLALFVLIGLATGIASLAIWVTDAAAISILAALGLTAGASVAAVWLFLSLVLVLQVVLVEGQGAVASLRRSFELIQGNWWRTFGYLFVIGVIAGFAANIVGILLMPLYFIGFVVPAVFAIAYGLSAVVFAPTLAASAAGYTLWYVDLRSRREVLSTEELIELS